jgi:hypothetical protein
MILFLALFQKSSRFLKPGPFQAWSKAGDRGVQKMKIEGVENAGVNLRSEVTGGARFSTGGVSIRRDVFGRGFKASRFFHLPRRKPTFPFSKPLEKISRTSKNFNRFEPLACMQYTNSLSFPARKVKRGSTRPSPLGENLRIIFKL